jgi:uncharacterized membrane protein YhaH (DUF805 family)
VYSTHPLIRSIPHGFTNIFRWGGRDTRMEFWPYLLLCLVVASVLQFAVLKYVVQFLLLATTQLTEPSNELFAAALLETMASLAFVVVFSIVAGAAIVRRLHDGGWSGRWFGLTAIAEIVRCTGLVTAILMQPYYPQFAGALGIFGFLGSMATLPLKVAVFVFLWWNTERYDNRFGTFEPSDVDRLRWLANEERESPQRCDHFNPEDWQPV